MNRIKISQRFSDHLIQAVFIFTSVFLVFWLNGYIIEQNEKQAANIAQEAIIEEMNWT